jgi:CBS domain-containing protein
MTAITMPLMDLTADDLMTRDVVMIPQEMSLRAAAHLLSRHQISGAPVVDVAGRCIGVLSATDFVRWTGEGERAAKPRLAAEPCVCAWQVLELEDLPGDGVGAHMTPDPVMVPPHTPIGQLARCMLDAHIHRVIVVDEQHRPVGVVSTTDLLAAVARADAEV